MLLTITQVRLLVCLSPWDHACQTGTSACVPSSVSTTVARASSSVATAVAAPRSSVARGDSLSGSDAGVASANSLAISIVDCSSRLGCLGVAKVVGALRAVLAPCAGTHAWGSTPCALLVPVVATVSVSLMPSKTSCASTCRTGTSDSVWKVKHQMKGDPASEKPGCLHSCKKISLTHVIT